MNRNSYPEELVVIIDCEQQFRLSVQLEGEQLGVFYVVATGDNYYSDELSLLLEQLDWEKFFHELDEIGLWQWQPLYRAADNCRWGIQITYAGKQAIIECINESKNAVVMDELPTVDRMLFLRLLRALGELTGQDFVSHYHKR